MDLHANTQAVACEAPADAAPACAALPADGSRPTCATCSVRRFCLPSWSDGGAPLALEQLMIGRRRLRKGQAVYREGDRFLFMYAVRYGTLKSAVALAEGREQVMAFHLPGELFGFDGQADGRHPTTTVALEDTEVCALPYSQLSDAAGESRAVRHHLTQLVAAELVRERRIMALIANTGSEQRVAAFLLYLAERMRTRGYSAREFHLRMTREEIGSYLGTTLETVSRSLSSFARQGYLDVHRRRIAIVDAEGLANACGVGSALLGHH